MSLFIFFVLSSNVLAQNGDDYLQIYHEKTDVSKLSPTAFAFQNYVSHKEMNSSGMIDIEVPVYTIEDKDITVPIALDYNPNRLKVNSIASWVGTGWMLRTGGIITREVKGKPDDVHYMMGPVIRRQINYGTPSFWTHDYGGLYWLSGEIKERFRINSDGTSRLVADFPNNLQNDEQHGFGSDTTTRNYKLAVGGGLRINSYDIDWEPDVYAVTIPEGSFKFVFNESGVPKILNGSNDFAIQYEFQEIDYDNLVPGINFVQHDGATANRVLWFDTKIKSFTLISPTGTKYIFNEQESSQLYGRSLSWITSGGLRLIIREYPKHITAWHLSKIVSSNGNETIFTYSSNTYTEIPPLNLIAGACEDGSDCSQDDIKRFKFDARDHIADITGSGFPTTYEEYYYPLDQASPTISNPVSLSTLPDRRSRFIVDMKTLSSIETDNIKVDLISNTNREDLLGTPRLDRLEVRDKINNSIIKSFTLDFSYQTDNNAPASVPSNEKKRLILNGINEWSIDNTLSISTRFEYNTLTLPYRYAKAQDAWGYFNDRDYHSLIPKLYVYPNQPGPDTYRIYPIDPSVDPTVFELPGADRNVNETAILAGTLSKIIFPTGGYREYEFEPNDFWDEKGLRNVQGGGLRLKSVTHQDDLFSANSIKRSYTYRSLADNMKSSGQVVYPPIFGKETNFYLEKGDILPNVFLIPGDPNSWSGTLFEEWNRFTKRNATPFNTLSDIHGISIYYTSLTENVLPDAGKIDYTFYSPNTYKTGIVDRREGLIDGCDYCDFYFDPAHSTNESLIQQINPTDRIRRFNETLAPYPPISNRNISVDLKAGKIQQKDVFRANATYPLRTETYEYELIFQNPELVYGVVNSIYEYMDGYLGTDEVRGWNTIAKYGYSTNQQASLSRVVRRDYSSNNSGDFIESTENYSYTNNYNQIRSKEYSSPTERSKTEYRYVFDVTGENIPGSGISNSLQGFVDWKNGNRISTPLEQLNYKLIDGTNQLVGGQLAIPRNHTDFASTTKGAYIKEIYQLKVDQPITSVSPLSVNFISGEIIFDSHYDLEADFKDYDNYGNPLQVWTSEGIIQDLEWSVLFNGAYLTKKTINSGLPGEQSQAIDYYPLIGAKSITDQNGRVTTYSYDDFNRLEEIKDHNGNILKHYEYNFYSQQPSN